MDKAGLRLAVSMMLLAPGWGAAAEMQKRDMTFFITSVGLGNGADLGGLAGADRHCQSLATSVGAGKRTWRAYLSTSAADGKPAVNARDRIGKGPWHNKEGRLIARDVKELHGINNINWMTALNERGERVNTNASPPNMHDILTGSQPDGTAIAGDPAKTTCGNWTLSGAGAAIVGHHDRLGVPVTETSTFWNAAHLTRGCGQDNLRSTGGAGLFYCFAVK
jgi:hypothetical protein